MELLVTGGSGFVGGHIMEELEKFGHEIINFSPDIPVFESSSKYIGGKLPDDINKLKQYPLIFHCAGQVGTSVLFNNMSETAKTNIMGNIALLEKHKDFGTIIQPNLTGTWLNPYMVSKNCGEKYGLMYAEHFKTKYYSMKMGDIFGPRQSSGQKKCVPTFIKQALMNDPITIYGDGSYMMRLMYVKDVAKILVDLGFRLFRDDYLIKYIVNNVTHIGSVQDSNNISVYDLAKLIVQMTNSNSQIKFFAQREGQPPDVKGYELNTEQSNTLYNMLGFHEMPLTRCLQETINYYDSMFQAR